MQPGSPKKSFRDRKLPVPCNYGHLWNVAQTQLEANAERGVFRNHHKGSPFTISRMASSRICTRETAVRRASRSCLAAVNVQPVLRFDAGDGQADTGISANPVAGMKDHPPQRSAGGCINTRQATFYIYFRSIRRPSISSTTPTPSSGSISLVQR